MTSAPPRKVFINLPVRDLSRSIAFFTQLGFTFNAPFTDETASMMNLGDDAHAMLITEPRFREFTPKAICDTSTHTEVLIALSAASREEVDDLVRRAMAAGGSPASPSQDYGFMYGWSFQDLDGHTWEVVWMDPSYIQD
jgi:predicted lactoylglutathione lyase